MGKEKLIDKIKKLMALGESPNPHEAELAMEKAAKLMAAHNISVIDVEASDGTIEEHIHEVNVDGAGGSVDRWEGTMALMLCEIFDCEAVGHKYPKWQKDEFGKKDAISFIGHDDDLALVVHFFIYLRRWIGRKAEVNYRLKRDQEAYALGCIDTIKNRMKAVYVKMQEYIPADTMALMVVKKGAVSTKAKELYPNARVSKYRSKGSYQARAHGEHDGNKARISRPVAGGNGDAIRQIA